MEAGKEEDEDTPTATCRCLSHTPGESPSDMIADIVAATTSFIPEEDDSSPPASALYTSYFLEK